MCSHTEEQFNIASRHIWNSDSNKIIGKGNDRGRIEHIASVVSPKEKAVMSKVHDLVRKEKEKDLKIGFNLDKKGGLK